MKEALSISLSVSLRDLLVLVPGTILVWGNVTTWQADLARIWAHTLPYHQAQYANH